MPRYDDIHPDHIDPDTGRPYANYSSPALDTSFHDHEMDVDDAPEDELRAILREWKCACTGGFYLHRGRDVPNPRIGEWRACLRCGGSGLDPRATRAAALLAEIAPEPIDGPDDSCTSPRGHSWVYTGTGYGGDDESYYGEGRCYCEHCGADGDA